MCAHTCSHAAAHMHQSRYFDVVSDNLLQMFLYVRKLRLTLKTEIFSIQKEDAFQPGLVEPGSNISY